MNDANRSPAESRKTHDDVLRVEPMHFEKRAVVNDHPNQIVDAMGQ